MSFITGDIKHILSINIKTRYDDLPDQYNRLFMIKMFIICSLIIGFDYFNDTVSCLLPSDSHLTPGFVSSTCWIEGFYIYRELADNLPKTKYYGIPRDLNLDGMYVGTSYLCKVSPKSKFCAPMTKSYYLQYQYMTFYTAALTVIYYFPYIIFRLANQDIICLRKHITGESLDINYIIKNYFGHRANSKYRMRLKNILNIIIKVLYIAVNALAFVFTDGVLGGRYKSYGIKWVRWARTKMLDQYEQHTTNQIQKPGNQLLPSMGICEIEESAQDVASSLVNTSRLICELSPHILYQYCFLVLWFSMIFGILISITGFIGLIIGYIGHLLCCYETLEKSDYKLYKEMTLREREYLDYIKAKNVELYSEIIRRLKALRCHVVEREDDEYRETDSISSSYKDRYSEQFEFM